MPINCLIDFKLKIAQVKLFNTAFKVRRIFILCDIHLVPAYAVSTYADFAYARVIGGFLR